MHNSKIRDATSADSAEVIELNNHVVRWTSLMDELRLAELARLASYYRVVAAGEDVAGFLIAIPSGSQYQNTNFAWFASKFQDFMYIDRIVISPGFSGNGFGRLLYEDLFRATTRSGINRVVCEYNVIPMNESSRAFHAQMGFREIGQQELPHSGKTVSMQEIEV